MAEPLLIHSMAEFSCITLEALQIANAKHVCEIGAEHGGNSVVLTQWLEERNGTLTSIDPAPSEAYLGWQKQHTDCVQLIKHLSFETIPKLDSQDAWFIDGDHNWFTVYHELNAIYALQRNKKHPFLAFLHDISWPWARRDLYYAPDRIPAEFLRPHSWDHGVTLGSTELIDGGFRGCGAFAIARHQGGERNGVLSAVEDFEGEHPEEFYWAHIPGVFGLVILFDRDHPAALDLVKLLAPLHDHLLLKRLETNRLANYLKVIELQDEAARTTTKQA